jgi:hypothetical protein
MQNSYGKTFNHGGTVFYLTVEVTPQLVAFLTTTPKRFNKEEGKYEGGWKFFREFSSTDEFEMLLGLHLIHGLQLMHSSRRTIFPQIFPIQVKNHHPRKLAGC